jgi:3'-phosphoadenosine 5'-phosphosulfate sulfotransferase (PAPS reductase)/FAD synthetase
VRKEELLSYDHYIVAFSGGKDCTAAFLHLLEEGVDRSKIELWHHEVDGKEASLMDWPVTPTYCKAFADHFQIPLYLSWKDGGFEREMLRENNFTAPIFFEQPNGTLGQSRKGNGKLATRRKFPQVSANLSVRWCSAYLKIDVGSAAISNQRRFDHKRVLVISGERGEESPCRAKYANHEVDRADNRFKGTYQNSYTRVINGKKKTITTTVTLGKKDRLVDRYRPVKDWMEYNVWAIIERWKIRVHPCYYLGYSRCSCAFCIFGDNDQLATSDYLLPCQSQRISNYEQDFGTTIKRTESLPVVIRKGVVYPEARRMAEADIIQQTTYPLSIEMPDWYIPAGAFGKGSGPS